MTHPQLILLDRRVSANKVLSVYWYYPTSYVNFTVWCKFKINDESLSYVLCDCNLDYCDIIMLWVQTVYTVQYSGIRHTRIPDIFSKIFLKYDLKVLTIVQVST